MRIFSEKLHIVLVCDTKVILCSQMIHEKVHDKGLMYNRFEKETALF